MLNQQQIEVLVKQLKFPQYPIIREYLQTVFLQHFYQHQELSTTYFKGGTCLRLVFHSSRFSEDLDFTTNLKLEILTDILSDTMKSLAMEFPMISVKPKKSLAGATFGINYLSPGIKMPITIKVDFSFRESVIDPELSTITSIYPVNFFTPLPHLSLKEILAEKIRAITHRQKGRDMFDLYYLLARQTPLDVNLIKKKMVFYQEELKWKRVIHAINSFPINHLVADLSPFVTAAQRIQIKNLPNQTVQLLNERLQST